MHKLDILLKPDYSNDSIISKISYLIKLVLKIPKIK